MGLEKIPDKFFSWVLKVNLRTTKGILRNDFIRFHPMIPDLNTLVDLIDEAGPNIPWRAAYFIVLILSLKRCNYKRKIIYEENYQQFLDYARNYNVNIMTEIGVLNNWVNVDFDELLKQYLSLLIKISAIEMRTKLRFKIEFEKEV